MHTKKGVKTKQASSASHTRLQSTNTHLYDTHAFSSTQSRCGHCKAMAPAWEQLGTEFSSSSSVLIGNVDCTVESSLCGKYGVDGYPTVKYFLAGDKVCPYLPRALHHQFSLADSASMAGL
jgi:hypothetical protein